MSQNRLFTDEELTAYLDNEGEHTPVREIEAALESDVGLQRRLEALTFDTSLISKGFLTVSPDEPTVPKLPTRQPTRSQFSFPAMAAAATLALAVGLGSGVWWAQSDDPDWRDYVASYQALYSTETLSHTAQSDEKLKSELTRVASAIGKDIQLDTLTDNAAVVYKRGQVLSFQGRPVIQLAFLSKVGEPIALCILRSQNSSKEQLSFGSMEDMNSASWSDNGYEYLLIGGKDSALISKLASSFSKSI